MQKKSADKKKACSQKITYRFISYFYTLCNYSTNLQAFSASFDCLCEHGTNDKNIGVYVGCQGRAPYSTNSILFNPFLMAGISLTVWYSNVWMVHYIFWGVTGYYFQIKLYFCPWGMISSSKPMQTLIRWSNLKHLTGSAHLGLHCFSIYQLTTFPSRKG